MRLEKDVYQNRDARAPKALGEMEERAGALLLVWLWGLGHRIFWLVVLLTS